MKHIMLSDIHGNLEALTAVLEDCGPGQLYVLGDIIGYGADPGKCVKRIRQSEAIVIRGNHEQVQLDWNELKHFNPLARESAEYPRTRHSPADHDWLSQLPYEWSDDAIYLSHGSPYGAQRFYYLMPGDVRSPYLTLSLSKLERLGLGLAFHGHTHIPGYFFIKDGRPVFLSLAEDTVVKLDSEARYLINCGSVGQPRNHNPKAQYLIYDEETFTLEKRSVAYDAALAAEKIRSAGLPSPLWERILQGI